MLKSNLYLNIITQHYPHPNNTLFFSRVCHAQTMTQNNPTLKLFSAFTTNVSEQKVWRAGNLFALCGLVF